MERGPLDLRPAALATRAAGDRRAGVRVSPDPIPQFPGTWVTQARGPAVAVGTGTRRSSERTAAWQAASGAQDLRHCHSLLPEERSSREEAAAAPGTREALGARRTPRRSPSVGGRGGGALASCFQLGRAQTARGSVLGTPEGRDLLPWSSHPSPRYSPAGSLRATRLKVCPVDLVSSLVWGQFMPATVVAPFPVLAGGPGPRSYSLLPRARLPGPRGL